MKEPQMLLIIITMYVCTIVVCCALFRPELTITPTVLSVIYSYFYGKALAKESKESK